MANKYIVEALSCHSDRTQQIYRNGQIVLETDFHTGHAALLCTKGFLRPYTDADAEAEMLRKRGIALPEVTFSAIYESMTDDRLRERCREINNRVVGYEHMPQDTKEMLTGRFNDWLPGATREDMIAAIIGAEKMIAGFDNIEDFVEAAMKNISAAPANEESNPADSNESDEESNPDIDVVVDKQTLEDNPDLVDAGVQEGETIQVPTKYTLADYEAMTNKQLKELLDAQGTDYDSKANKATLIELLTNPKA